MTALNEDPSTGEDPELTEAIRLTLASSGFDLDDPEALKLVELALRKKLEMIAANAHFYAGSQSADSGKTLQLSHLQPALAEAKIRIDRPEFIVEQPQSKMATRRKSSK
jgi:hypothetical protein